MILSIILQAISLKAVNFCVHRLYPIVGEHLLLLELFEHQMFSIKVLFDFIQYRTSSISFSLEDSKIGNRLSPVMVCDSNLRFEVFILIPLAHNVDLHHVIVLVSIILTVYEALHVLNILLTHVVLLD